MFSLSRNETKQSKTKQSKKTKKTPLESNQGSVKSILEENRKLFCAFVLTSRWVLGPVVDEETKAQIIQMFPLSQ